jgi:hypothetical protein
VAGGGYGGYDYGGRGGYSGGDLALGMLGKKQKNIIMLSICIILI